jgi:hypothetical protein
MIPVFEQKTVHALDHMDTVIGAITMVNIVRYEAAFEGRKKEYQQ